MKLKFKYTFFWLVALAGCSVPDFREINPKPLKDAPAFIVTPSGDKQGTAGVTTTILYGQSVDFKIDVVDAPGKVSNVVGMLSDPSYGNAVTEVSSLATLKGAEKGSTKITLQVINQPADGLDRSLNFDIAVTDSQIDEKGSVAPKTTIVTLKIILTKGPCVTSSISVGTYKVTEASGILDGGTPYSLTDLQGLKGDAGPITVVITSTRSGLYALNEVTGGIWPLYYPTRANPALSVDLCGSTITGHTGSVTAGSGSAARLFTLNGSFNSDSTITITWSYVRVAGGTPSPAANGSYTLTKI